MRSSMTHCWSMYALPFSIAVRINGKLRMGRIPVSSSSRSQSQAHTNLTATMWMNLCKFPDRRMMRCVWVILSLVKPNIGGVGQDDPVIEYEDEFGRLRTARRSNVPRGLMPAQQEEPDEDE